MELFRTLNQQLEKMNRLLVKRGNTIEDMMKNIRNNIRRCAGLQQLQTPQPRFSVRADILKDKNTHESREEFAPTGDWEISRLNGSMTTRCV